jgi:hypothetical protein
MGELNRRPDRPDPTDRPHDQQTHRPPDSQHAANVDHPGREPRPRTDTPTHRDRPGEPRQSDLDRFEAKIAERRAYRRPERVTPDVTGLGLDHSEAGRGYHRESGDEARPGGDDPNAPGQRDRDQPGIRADSRPEIIGGRLPESFDEKTAHWLRNQRDVAGAALEPDRNGSARPDAPSALHEHDESSTDHAVGLSEDHSLRDGADWPPPPDRRPDTPADEERLAEENLGRLTEKPDSASLEERVRGSFYDNIDDVFDVAEETGGVAHDILVPPTGHAEVRKPQPEYKPQVPDGIDGGHVALAGMVIGVLGYEASRRARQALSDLKRRSDERHG